MIRSQKELFDVAVSLTSAARTATTNGSAVDLQGYNAATAVILPVSWTDGSHSFKLQDSPDSSTWTDVVAAQLDGTSPVVVTSSGTAVPSRIGYLGGQRYIRVVLTASGTTTGAVIGAHVVRAEPKKAPK